MVPLFFVNKKTTAQNKVMTLFYTVALCAINYNRELGKKFVKYLLYWGY
ncbi:conserved hypothetical protein [Brochothrix thermosphacta]|nr:hypothetical protein FM106_27330 [Brachybacterium faecium]SOC31390.1 hypothetical protein BTH160X_60133 [Brochothrix thermosphacta]SPP30483.1 conserved hypothetical protein [Brochothrix thermosphacta]